MESEYRLVSKKFFCHNCRKQFSSLLNSSGGDMPNCPICKDFFIEEINEDSKGMMIEEGYINPTSKAQIYQNNVLNIHNNPAEELVGPQIGSESNPIEVEQEPEGYMGDRNFGSGMFGENSNMGFENSESPIIRQEINISNGDGSTVIMRSSGGGRINEVRTGPGGTTITTHSNMPQHMGGMPGMPGMSGMGGMPGIGGMGNMAQMQENMAQSFQPFFGNTGTYSFGNRGFTQSTGPSDPMQMSMQMPSIPGFPHLSFSNFFNEAFGQEMMPGVSSFQIPDFHLNYASNFGDMRPGEDLLSMIQRMSMEEHKSQPTSEQVVTNLPVFSLQERHCKRNDKGEIELPNCPICCETLQLADKALLIPCGHMFHSQCILPWLNQNSTCPVCRHQLPTD